MLPFGFEFSQRFHSIECGRYSFEVVRSVPPICVCRSVRERALRDFTQLKQGTFRETDRRCRSVHLFAYRGIRFTFFRVPFAMHTGCEEPRQSDGLLTI